MKIKTSDLIGDPLDWAVATCLGYSVGVVSADDQWERFIEYVSAGELDKYAQDYASIRAGFKPVLCKVHSDGYKSIIDASEWKFSTNWAQGGPIIDREGIYFSPLPDNGIRAYRFLNGTYCSLMDCWGKDITRLIVAMRCYVASKLGDEVDIPEELLS